MLVPEPILQQFAVMGDKIIGVAEALGVHEALCLLCAHSQIIVLGDLHRQPGCSVRGDKRVVPGS